MADEVSYDVKFRAIAETSGIDTLEQRLKKVREEIKAAQQAQPGAPAAHKASWEMGPGGDPGITEGRKSAGNHWSSNPETIRKMQEAKKLQDEINRLRAQETAEAAKRARAAEKAAATKPAAGLGKAAKVVDEVDGVMQARKGLQGGAALARLGARMGLGTGAIAELMTAGATVMGTLGAVTAGLAALSIGAAAAGVAVVVSADQAAQSAKQLDSVGGVTRDRMKRDMGPVGEILDANRNELVQYGKEMDRVKNLFGDFVKGLGAGALPAVEKIIGPLSKIDTAGMGKSIGDFISAILGAEHSDPGESDQQKDKREDLAKQSALLEAQARGDTREVWKLKKQAVFDEAIKAGAPVDAALRLANATDAANRANSTKKFPMSDLGSRGGSVKESLLAAGMSPGAYTGMNGGYFVGLKGSIDLLTKRLDQPLETRLRADDEE